MVLEKLLEKVNVKSRLGKLLYHETNLHTGVLDDKYKIYKSNISKHQVFVDSSGKICFGGADYQSGYLREIDGEHLFQAISADKKWCGWYNKDGYFYESLVDAHLGPIKEKTINYQVWDPLHKSSLIIYDKILGSYYTKAKFFHGLVTSINRLIEENSGNEDLLQKRLTQFVKCFEYFASHPDEALDFSGGLGR